MCELSYFVRMFYHGRHTSSSLSWCSSRSLPEGETMRSPFKGRERSWTLGVDDSLGDGLRARSLGDSGDLGGRSWGETGGEKLRERRGTCTERGDVRHWPRWATRRWPTSASRPGRDRRKPQASLAHWLNPAWNTQLKRFIMMKSSE